jgi:hypothetical protein
MHVAKSLIALLLLLLLWAGAGAVEGEQGQGTLYDAARMAEERTFALKREADEAEQLLRLCNTGFGPVERCATRRLPQAQQQEAPNAPPPSSYTSGPATVSSQPLNEAWAVSIIGWDDKPIAWVRPPGGAERKISRAGIQIDGWTVDSLTTEGVHLSRFEVTRTGEIVTDATGEPVRRRMTLLPSRQSSSGSVTPTTNGLIQQGPPPQSLPGIFQR